MLQSGRPIQHSSIAARTEPRQSLAAVVVTHNRIGQLRVTMDRLLGEDLDHLLVLDNNSDDGTAEFLNGIDDPRLTVLHQDRNLGGAGGFEQGLRHAVAVLDPDWIVVMDDDGRPCRGAIERFRRLDTRGLDAISAAVWTPSGKICEMNRPYRNPFWHLPEFLRVLGGQGRRGFHLGDTAYQPGADPTDIDMASFVGLFLSRDSLARAGFPDGRLFIYGDDQLYTLQMRRLGLRIGFCPGLRFEHDTRSIQTDGTLVLRPLWKVYYMYRNALIAYRVAAGPWFWPLLPILLAKWRRQARHYGPDRGAYRKLLARALSDGLHKRLDRSHQDVMTMADACAAQGRTAFQRDGTR